MTLNVSIHAYLLVFTLLLGCGSVVYAQHKTVPDTQGKDSIINQLQREKKALQETHLKDLEVHKKDLIRIHKEDIRLRNQRVTIVMILTSACFVLILASLYRNNQVKKKVNSELEEKVQERTLHFEKAVAKLARTNHELDNFLYRASHDLKGPLVTMEGLCNIALIEKEKSDTDRYLQMQLQILERMKLLLFRIIEIGQIRSHAIHPQSIPLRKYCRGIIRSMNRVDGFKDVDFRVEIPENVQITADIEMLDTAMDNIIRNAIEHNRSYYSKRYIRIGLIEDALYWEVHIANNGMSIPEQIADKVFSLFFKNNDKTKGFGLGLYKTRVAGEKLGGEIKLVQSNDEETVFAIVIPKKTPQPNQINLN
jgi:signal transduction histidine kinase